MSKYHNKKTVVDGRTFDSRKEANRYCELKLLQRAGEIYDLSCQVPFKICEAGYKKGKMLFKASYYYADFTYRTKDGEFVVEDVKSKATKTDLYKLKKKLLYNGYGYEVHEYE